MATWYIDNRLTSGSNNGTSPANAWWSIQDAKVSGSISAGDTVNFVAGSGPYFESFSTNGTGWLTDIGFSSPNQITSVSTDLTTFGFSSGDILEVEILSSVNTVNRRQFQISGAPTTHAITVTPSAVVTLAAGNRTRLVDISAGGNIASFDPGGNGGAGNPITWAMNGVEIRAGWVIGQPLGPQFKWNKSTFGQEYYLTAADGTNPCLVQVVSGTVNGNFMTATAGTVAHAFGTVGSLANQQLGWGNNDTLGYNTLYVRNDAGNPINLSIGFSRIAEGIYTTWQNHTWVGGVFTYSNDCGINSNAAAGVWNVQRCLFQFQANHALGNGGAGTLISESCIAYWTGHRLVDHYTSSGGLTQIYNCIACGPHLFALIDTGSTGTIQIFSSICVHNEAGAIDRKSTAVLVEECNCWYPTMTAAGGALGYVDPTNWPTTNGLDIPKLLATTTNTQGALTDPLFNNINDTNYSLCDFHLSSLSRCRGRGAWNRGSTYTDFAGNQYQSGGAAHSVNMGVYQDVIGNTPRAIR